MSVLASFNYDGPPAAAVVTGLLFAGFVLWALAYVGRVVLGLVVGAVSWSIIAGIVIAYGSGDLTELLALVFATIFGVIGGILGGIAGYVGRARKNRFRLKAQGQDKIGPNSTI